MSLRIKLWWVRHDAGIVGAAIILSIILIPLWAAILGWLVNLWA